MKRIIISILMIAFVLFFFLGKGNKKEYFIPKLYFYGNISGMQDKTDVRKIRVKYSSNDINFESNAKLKVQGASSLNYDKKNYNITFYDNEYNEKRDIGIKWGEYNKYTLKANYIDCLHFRNIVTANIASEINKKYHIFDGTINNGLTDGFPIEIYINDEFLGLYTLNIHKDYLFKTKDNNPLVIAAKDKYKETLFKKQVVDWKQFEVENGDANNDNLNKLKRLVNFVIESNDQEFTKEFENYFNLDSVLNYYCMIKFAELTDNISRNLYLVSYDGNIWYTALYDLDISFGNTNRFGMLQDYTKDLSEFINESNLWSKFERNFSDLIAQRYRELRRGILTKSNVINKVNDFYELIPNETIEKDNNRWNKKSHYGISYLDLYLDMRMKAIDDNIYKNNNKNQFSRNIKIK